MIPFKAWRLSRSAARRIGLGRATKLFLLLLCVTQELSASASAEQTQPPLSPLLLSPPASLGSEPCVGSFWPKVRIIRDLETLWEVPQKPKGVLFVAHGCSHQGSDFWQPSARCKHCLGLPEECLVREVALQRGYAVVAVTSFNRTSGCWHNTQAEFSEDLQRLPSILLEVLEEEGLLALQLVAFGASSGGGIVLRLAGIMPDVQGVIAQVVPARPSLLQTTDASRCYPPVLFAHMAAKDPAWAEQVQGALLYCRGAGIPAAEVEIDAQPVTPQLLQRERQVDVQMGEAMVAALRGQGMLDEAGFLKDDPRTTRQLWQAALQPVVGSLSLEPDASGVAQLLNVAYARHELTSDSVDISLAWLEAGGATSLGALLEQQGQALPPLSSP
ncbi:hypothetical protein D9Q98_006282 [Chlorella vulgaris]|uniref:Uncharacterized protein n=1 Tax=Chlorella vulgaris TaxID=3077 RepID=A0A9D4TXC7_CHLVU|nr:hypothetical protein D9Q98_006282 [Chlorella vulgaris]